MVFSLLLTMPLTMERNSFSVGNLRTPLSNQYKDWTFVEADLKTSLVLCHSALKTASFVALKEWQVREVMSFVSQRGWHSEPRAKLFLYSVH